jgi:hypothetical protein
VPLARLNTALAARGQWLPVDSAFAATTVGGALATNDSGPLRHRFGTPRDLPDRHHARAHRWARGEIGRHRRQERGRLRPRKARDRIVRRAGGGRGRDLQAAAAAARSATLRAVYSDSEPLAADAAAIAAGQLEPMAFDVRAATPTAAVDAARAVRVEPRGVARSSTRGARSCTATHRAARRLEARAWAEQVALPWERGEARSCRCSWLPSRLGDVLAIGARAAGRMRRDVAGRVGAGSGLLRLDGDDAADRRAIGRAARRRRRSATSSAARQPRAANRRWTCGARRRRRPPPRSSARSIQPAF